ncbi:MAG TPA: 50S ribosomal protein L24 [Fibrobacteraceae bacterium]|nr:50S ribosomal protein L24 [Fibrobacteraceae bacterium]
MNIKKNDTVKVIAGSCKGKTGQVVRVILDKNQVVVGGVNIGKRHEKPSRTNQTGGIVDKEMPLAISNVMIVDPKTGVPTRIRRKREPGKASVRVSVKSGTVLD